MRRALSLFAALVVALPAAASAQDKPAGPTFEPYGFALFHGFFADGIFENKDNAYRVVATGATDSSGFYQFSVRGSRLGFRVGNLDASLIGATASLVLEYDVQGGFFGAGGSTRTWLAPGMRLRLANGKIDWKTQGGNIQFLAGQDFGLVGPVFANSVTYGTDPVFVRAGKIYRRSPQLRLSYGNTWGMFTLNVAIAALAAVENDVAPNTGTATDYGPGNRSRVPDAEGRALFGVKVPGILDATANVAYHLHTRRYTNQAQGHKDLTAAIVSAGLDAGITQWVQVKGELYANDGADDSYLGILPGVAKPTGTDLNTYKTLKSTGYWGQLTVKPLPYLWVAGGYGIEEADSASKTLLGTSGWFKNTQIHGAVISNLSKNLALSLEVVQVESSNTAATAGGADVKYKANQYSFSMRTSF